MTTPQRYRKKPVVIEASRWLKDGDHSEVGLYRYLPVDPITGEISAGVDAILMGQMKHSEVPEKFRRDTCHDIMDDHGWVDTLEGGHMVCPGDYIIRGVQGELYPCKPEIFTASYEEADNG